MDKKKKMEKYCKRSASVILGVLSAISAFGTAGISAEGTPSEVTMNESYTIEYGDMGGRTVVRTLHDDSGEEGYAYCTNPLEPNPPSGSVSTEPIEIISGDYSPGDAAKVLYYGFCGPGFDASLFPAEAYYGGGWNDDKYFVCTHVMVSYVALGRKETATAGAWDLREPFFYQYILQDTLGKILAKPAPPSDFHAFMLSYGSGYQILYGFTYADSGRIKVEKTSANSAMTNGNSSYSLQGAQYGIYESKSDAENNRNAVEILTTDGSGNAESGDLKANTRYFVREIKASKGFEIDPKIYQADVISNAVYHVSSKEVPDNDPVFLTLTKISEEGNSATAMSLEGAVFELHYVEGNRTWYFQTLKKGDTYRIRFTDKAYLTGGDDLYTMDGNVVFPLGTYELSETEAPEGYTLKGSYINENDGSTLAVDGEKAVFKVEKDGDHGTIRAGQKYTKSERPIFGGFRFEKNDADTGDRAQGDTDLSGSFEVINRNDYWVIVNGQEYGPDETVLIFKTDKKGKYETKPDCLSYGTYEIKETEAPKGYLFSEGTSVFEITEDGEIVDTDPIENDVMTGKFSLTKALTEKDEDEWAAPEEGIEFTAVLKRYADQYGSVEEAIKHKDEFTEKEYAVVTTDEKGNAVSGELAYGTYLIKQTSKTGEAGQIGDAAEFVVDENSPETPIHYNPVNKPMKYYLRLMKLDSETGENVVFNSASFKIKNKDTGEYEKMRVGSKVYDTFRTVSETAGDTKLPKGTFYAEEEDPGTVVTPLQVTAGTYIIEEVETPWGFTALKEPVEVVVESSSISAVEDGKNFKNVEIKNDRAYGTLKIQKKIEEYEADTSLIDRKDLSGIAFTLTAAEDIIDPITGTVLYEAGKEYGSYHPDKDGSLEVKNIPLGRYTLKETTVPDGLIRDEKVYDVVFEQKDQETPEYPVQLEIENRTTKAEITKQDVTGDGELEGASLVVKNSAGETVDEWVSGTKPHSIEGLKAGEEYTLTETIAPEGYAKATTISFKVNEDGSVTPVRMIDKVVSFKKSDGLGKEVPGAHVTVTDEEGNVIDDFVSTEEDHIINGVEVGKTYTFHEEGAPDGYYYAEDAKVTITDDGLDQVIEMKDNAIGYRIFKIDDDGKPVPGVQLKLTDTTTNKVIREWTTDDKPAEFVKELIAGHQYLLEEEEWVNGVHSSAALTFTVPKTGTADFTIVNMFDALNEITILKTDNHGVPCPGAEMEIIEKETGETVYSFISIDDPKGTDISKYVKGDVTYILRESEAPFGFDAFYDMEFTVTGTRERKQIIVVNNLRKQYYVNVIKADAQDPDKYLKGAEFTLYTKDGKIAKDINGKECVTQTDDRGIAVFCVEFNGMDGYYVKETKAPKGYRLNKEEHPVTLSESYDFAAEHPVVITVNDEALPKIVRVVTGDKGIAGFAALLVVSLTAAVLIMKKKKSLKQN